MPKDRSVRALAWLEERYERCFRRVPASGVVDVALLEELVGELERVSSRIPSADARRRDAAALLDEARAFLDAATRAQDKKTPGADPKRWGGLANQQFETKAWRQGTHAPYSMLSLPLLERVAGRLRFIEAAMTALPPSDLATRNLRAVADNLRSIHAHTRRSQVFLARLAPGERERLLVESAEDIARVFEQQTEPHAGVVPTRYLDATIDRLDAVRLALEAIKSPTEEITRAIDVAADRLDDWIARRDAIRKVQIPAPDRALPDPEDPPQGAKLSPMQRVKRVPALVTLGASDDAKMACDGQLVTTPSALACFVTVGVRAEQSHFAEPTLLRFLVWVDKTSDYRLELRSELGRAGGPRPIHAFARLPQEKDYLYLGVATVVAHGRRESQSTWVDLSLEHPLPAGEWARFGGAHRVVAMFGKEYYFRSDEAPGHFARWFRSASVSVPHVEITGHDGARLTFHGAGQRVYVEYRPHPGAPSVECHDASASDTDRVEIACTCGLTRELRTDRTLPRDRAVEVLRALMDDGVHPSNFRAPPRTPGAPEWLRRYEDGESVAVWQELVDLGPKVDAPEHADAARAVARETMLRVRANLDRLVLRLRRLGYHLASTTPRRALTDAERADLARVLERGAMPLSLRTFYEVVGVVDLTQSEKQMTHDDLHARPTSIGILGHHGPLTIPPPGTFLAELDARKPGQATTQVGFFAEDCAKAGQSGDYTYLELPQTGADFHILEAGAKHERFIDFLRSTLAWGGFRGHLCFAEPGTADTEERDAWSHGPPSRAFRALLTEGLDPI